MRRVYSKLPFEAQYRPTAIYLHLRSGEQTINLVLLMGKSSAVHA